MSHKLASEGEPKRHSLFRNVSILALGNAIQLPLNFFVAVYTARTLGPRAFGALNFDQSIVAYFLILSSMGLPTLATRALARRAGSVQLITGQIISSSLVLGMIALGLECIVLLAIPLSHVDRIVLFILSSQLFIGAFNLSWVYSGLERLTVPAVSTLAGSIFRAIITVIFLRSSQNIDVAALAISGSSLLTVLIQIALFKRTYQFRIRVTSSLILTLIRKALPLAAAGLLIQVYYNVGPIMLKFMAGYESVAYYGSANRIIALFLSFTALYVQSFFPVVSRLFKSDPEWLRTALKIMLKIAVFVGVPISIGVSALSPTVVRMVYGAAYVSAGSILAVLIWSWFVIFLSVHYGNVLVACGGEREYAVGVGIGAVVAVLANWVLIPVVGAVGAAYANLISELAVWAFMIMAIGRYLGPYFVPWQYLGRVAFNGFATGWTAYLVSPHAGVWVAVTAAVGVYALLSWITTTWPSIRDVKQVGSLRKLEKESI